MGISHLHFAPGIDFEIKDNQLITNLASFYFSCDEPLEITSQNYEYCLAYNKTIPTKKLQISFPVNSDLKTIIHIS